MGSLPLQQNSCDLRCFRHDVTQKNSSHRTVQLRGGIRGRKDSQSFLQGSEQKARFPKSKNYVPGLLPRTLCRALLLYNQTLSFGKCRNQGAGVSLQGCYPQEGLWVHLFLRTADFRDGNQILGSVVLDLGFVLLISEFLYVLSAHYSHHPLCIMQDSRIFILIWFPPLIPVFSFSDWPSPNLSCQAQKVFHLPPKPALRNLSGIFPLVCIPTLLLLLDFYYLRLNHFNSFLTGFLASCLSPPPTQT